MIRARVLCERSRANQGSWSAWEPVRIVDSYTEDSPDWCVGVYTRGEPGASVQLERRVIDMTDADPIYGGRLDAAVVRAELTDVCQRLGVRIYLHPTIPGAVCYDPSGEAPGLDANLYERRKGQIA